VAPVGEVLEQAGEGRGEPGEERSLSEVKLSGACPAAVGDGDEQHTRLLSAAREDSLAQECA